MSDEATQGATTAPAAGTTTAAEAEAAEETTAPRTRSDGGPSAGMFPRVGRWSRGYDPEQVDEFFARARVAYEGPLEASLRGDDVRGVAFDLVRGGYAPSSVDGALDRLEGAFVRRERAAFVGKRSQQEWMAMVAERATTLYPRLVRPAGARFAPPEHGHGYAAEDVDAVLDRLVAYFDAGASLTSGELRTATFRSARGDRAYAEGPVDAFLARAVEVLLAVE